MANVATRVSWSGREGEAEGRGETTPLLNGTGGQVRLAEPPWTGRSPMRGRLRESEPSAAFHEVSEQVQSAFPTPTGKGARLGFRAALGPGSLGLSED